MTGPQPFQPFQPFRPSAVHVYSIELTTRFRGLQRREGVLFEGPTGWGEFCPFEEYDDLTAARWLAAGVEAATLGWPTAVRRQVAVNAIVPVVEPQVAHELVRASGCATAKVKVADRPDSLAADQARLEAVRDALGPSGSIRVDVNGVWDVDYAATAIGQLAAAAGGLEYVEQPCATVEELAALRRRVDVPIAADESIRRAADPLGVNLREAADVAVLKCTPLGGVRRSLAVAEAIGLPCVVSSALETSIGLAAELALAAALPELDYACGLGTMALMTSDVVAPESSLHPVGGVLATGAHPRLDPEAAQAVRLADPARRRWWLERFERALQLMEHV